MQLSCVNGPTVGAISTANILKRHDQFVAFNFYCKIMLISISYNYCSVLVAIKSFNKTELGNV